MLKPRVWQFGCQHVLQTSQARGGQSENVRTLQAQTAATCQPHGTQAIKRSVHTIVFKRNIMVY